MSTNGSRTRPQRRSIGNGAAPPPARTRRLQKQASSPPRRSAPLVRQEQRLAALAREVAEGGSEATRAGTRVVLADRLQHALRDGAPYAEVLAALEPASHRSRLALRRSSPSPAGRADRGRPRQSLPPPRRPIIRDRAAAPRAATGFCRMAERVVTVRSLNEPGPAASRARRADRGRARKREPSLSAPAFDALAGTRPPPSEAWGRQLKQRAAADAAARAIAADAVAALNTATR